MTKLSDQALVVLHEWVQSESLRRHCYAVADSMRHFAELQDADADLWQAVGLLHDMDYERHPNQEQSATELGMPLDDVIAGVVAALQADADRLNLAGDVERGADVPGKVK